LIEAKELQNKRIEALEKQVADLQSQLNKPSGDYASAADVKELRDAIKEVDKKRLADSDNVADQLERLRKALIGSAGRHTSAAPTEAPKTTFDATAPHMEYVVQSGDSLIAIAKAYRDKGVKVTVSQILAANPGLKPETMKAGQKIVIPVPGQ
jgi:LysM repeat protein